MTARRLVGTTALPLSQQITFRFAQNSQPTTRRGLVDVRLDSATGPVVATCPLVGSGGTSTCTDQVCTFAEPVTGSRRIYLAFRQAPGGPATNFGLLNWVQFSGQGIGLP